MRKLLFVINPISGGYDKTGFRKVAAAFCDKHHLPYLFVETTGKNDLNTLKEKLNTYLPSTVIACGGDGTINLVASAIRHDPIHLGIVPLGSANGMATELGIPSNQTEALKVILADHIRMIDSILVNDTHLCLHLCDIGLNAKLIKRFEKGTARGKLAYARHFFETIFSHQSVSYTFTLEDQVFSLHAEMVVFANARKYGTHAIVNPKGKIDDGLFEVCIFKPYPWYAIFRLAWLFFTGQLNYSPFVKIFSTRSVFVKASSPEDLQLDGESLGKHESFAVHINPVRLPVVTPNKK